jgi:hypothetical protein
VSIYFHWENTIRESGLFVINSSGFFGLLLHELAAGTYERFCILSFYINMKAGFLMMLYKKT